MLIVPAILAYRRSKRSSSKPKKNMADYKTADEAKAEGSNDEYPIGKDMRVLKFINQVDHQENDIN